MGFELRKGISFCEVSDRLLFLDIRGDRYFCLQPKAEHAFRSLLADSKPDEKLRSDLSPMLGTGTLVETAAFGVPHTFRIERHASLSLLDTIVRKSNYTEVAAATTAILTARLSLRWSRLHTILRAIDLRRTMWPRSGAVDLDALQDAATAFEGTSRLLRSHDQCLPRSIALARYLAARGLPADLVIGVRLRPFAAHAWVQSGKWLVNDSIDNIRSYTPILAV